MPKLNKTITIYRDQWRRAGFGTQATQLYNDKESTRYNKCCLGQYLEQCGVPLDDLARRETPDQVQYDVQSPEIGLLVDFLYEDSTLLADRAININDDDSITNDERERRLISLFEPNGITLVFIN